MNPAQLQQLRDRIAANHQPEDKRSDSRVFLRGWNEALDFVVRTIKEVAGEKP